jgi:hypothetical protein
MILPESNAITLPHGKTVLMNFLDHNFNKIRLRRHRQPYRRAIFACRQPDDAAGGIFPSAIFASSVKQPTVFLSGRPPPRETKILCSNKHIHNTLK